MAMTSRTLLAFAEAGSDVAFHFLKGNGLQLVFPIRFEARYDFIVPSASVCPFEFIFTLRCENQCAFWVERVAASAKAGVAAR